MKKDECVVRHEHHPLFSKEIADICLEAGRIGRLSTAQTRDILYCCWRRGLMSTAILRDCVKQNNLSVFLRPDHAVLVAVAAKSLHPIEYGTIDKNPKVEIGQMNSDGDQDAYVMYAVR